MIYVDALQVAGLVAAGGIGYGVLRAAHGRMRGDSKNAVRKDRWLLPKDSHEHRLDEAERWIATFLDFGRPKSEWAAYGQAEFVFRIVKDNKGSVRFYLDAPNDRLRGIQSNLPPTLEWHERDPCNEKPTSRFHVQAESAFLPFTVGGKTDLLPAVIRAMDPNTELRISFSPADTHRYLSDLRKEHEKYRPSVRSNANGFGGVGKDLAEELGQGLGEALFGTKAQKKAAPRPTSPLQEQSQQQRAVKAGLLPHETRQMEAIAERFHDIHHLFQVKIELALYGIHPNPRAAFQSVLAAMRHFADLNRLTESRRKATMMLSAPELAMWVHVPAPGEVEGMETIREHARTLNKQEFNDGVVVGFLRHPAQEAREIRLPSEQLKSHFVLTGMTGSGKSTTLTTMIDSMLEPWKGGTDENPQPGFTLFDPADSTAVILLSHIAKVLDGPDDPRWKKVHYVSFSNADLPVPMNFFHVLETDGILALLNQENSNAIRSNRMIRNAVETLKTDSIPHVLLGIPQLLKDERSREMVVTRAKQNDLSLMMRQFWERDFDTVAKNPAVFEPVENRIDPFSKGAARMVFGQPDWAFRVREWMDCGHILLIGVSALGEQAMDLFAGSLIEHYHWIAQKRPQDTSMVHYLLVDECHRAQTPIMRQIIREDRKFGLALGMITQSIEQLTSEIKKEILDNVQTVISLRQGLNGAPVVSELSQRSFSAEYLRKLPTNVAAVYSIIDGGGTSVETWANPPETYDGYGENAVVVPFSDKPLLNQRREDLKRMGRDMQKELGQDAQFVEKRLEKYLESAGWADEDELSDDAPKKRSKLY